MQGHYRRYKDIRRTLHGRHREITNVTRTLHRCYKDIIAKILIKYDQIVTKYYQNDQIHLEKIQERHFLRIKKTT